MTPNSEPALRGGPVRSPLVSALILALLGLGLIFCIGAAVGFIAAASKGTPGAADYAIGAALLVAAGLCAWQLIARSLQLARQPQEKTGPSMKKVRRLWTFLITFGLILGGIVGFLSVQTTKGDPRGLVDPLFGNAPISSAIAIVLLAGLALTCIVTLFYYRFIDEHDRAAQESASLVAINVYVVLVMGWWIAAKGQLVPAIDHGAVFVAVMLVWFATWLWRRYR